MNTGYGTGKSGRKRRALVSVRPEILMGAGGAQAATGTGFLFSAVPCCLWTDGVLYQQELQSVEQISGKDDANNTDQDKGTEQTGGYNLLEHNHGWQT